MNVASLDLCKALYEVSGWFDTAKYSILSPVLVGYDGPEKRMVIDVDELGLGDRKPIPLYDLGFLLRKLPDSTAIVYTKKGSIAHFGYRDKEDTYHTLDPSADTPEDAACKLAIELFKQNILTKEST